MALGNYIQLATNGGIDTFINYGIITNTGNTRAFYWGGGYVRHLVNYGDMGGIGGNRGGVGDTTPMSVTNYGIMGAIDTAWGKADITINNFGSIGRASNDGKTRHLAGGSYSFIIKNYALMITQNATTFNAFSGNAVDNSQVVLDGGSMRFFDSSAKVILDFGGNFSFGEAYSLDKLFVDMSGKSVLGVDFSRLTTKSDIYYLTQRGDNFIVNRAPQYGIIGTLYKSNIHTMNNFYTMSNSMIYPRKSYKSQNLGRTHSLLQHSPSLAEGARGWVEYPSLLDSAIPLKSYESFAYRNESINRRIQRQNKRNYNRKSQNQVQNLKENQRTSKTQTFSQNLSQNPNNSQTPHNYYFILTPFFNHNSFAKSGNYNLTGFDYGFLTAFSAKVAESNSLGAHFIFSYGSLGDSKDKDLSIKSLNLNIGINYKLDLIYDMFLKARGDFYYFSNTLDTLTIKNIKPNNLGFGASVIFGKDFNFGKGGILGIEAGIDYKALKTNEVSLNLQSYKQSLLNLIYADVGINYNKYFGGFGINLGTGFKANLAPKLAESILISNSQNLRFTLDNDKYLAYANAGISYLMQTKNFDMEFSFAYYGSFGDRVISNGGGVELRVVF